MVCNLAMDPKELGVQGEGTKRQAEFAGALKSHELFASELPSD